MKKTYTVTVSEVVDTIYAVQAKSKKQAKAYAEAFHTDSITHSDQYESVGPMDTIVLERAVCAVKVQEQ